MGSGNFEYRAGIREPQSFDVSYPFSGCGERAWLEAYVAVRQVAAPLT